MKIKTIINMYKIKMMTNEQYVNYLRKRGVVIGSGCNISKDANFGSEPWLIKLGNNVRITKGVEFITHDGGIWTLRHMGKINQEDVLYGSIVIEDNCNISWNTILMPGIHIGKNCVTAAGAVITKDMPEGTIWGGVPARRIETVEEYYEKIKDKVVPTFNMCEREKREYLLKYRPNIMDFHM